MIALSRRLIRQFRGACAKCVTGRPRGPAPCVVLRRAAGRVTLTASFPDVTLELASPTRSARDRDEVLVVPMSVLEAVEGHTDELVEFERTGGSNGVARWRERGAPRSVPVSFVLPGKQHDSLPRAGEMKSVPARLLAALFEAGRTASREDGRYALSRVQLKSTGQVVATDGKVAVLFGGFQFPFAGDALVPALSLFGCPELRDEREVRVGRTKEHLVVCAGDWTAWLAVAPSGKFPDVGGVMPRHAPTTAVIDDPDAALLVKALPELPGQGHEHRPVTLDANGALAVRGCDDSSGAQREVRLARSRATGPAARVVLDRRVSRGRWRWGAGPCA